MAVSALGFLDLENSASQIRDTDKLVDPVAYTYFGSRPVHTLSQKKLFSLCRILKKTHNISILTAIAPPKFTFYRYSYQDKRIPINHSRLFLPLLHSISLHLSSFLVFFIKLYTFFNIFLMFFPPYDIGRSKPSSKGEDVFSNMYTLVYPFPFPSFCIYLSFCSKIFFCFFSQLFIVHFPLLSTF